MFYTCLYATGGLELRTSLRRGDPDESIAARIASRWSARADRGAEERIAVRDRSAFVPVSALRADPHLEMHKRGG
jgi:cyclic pyranopterin phosphate synthase